MAVQPLIYVSQLSDNPDIRYILYGIEEEGIPFRIEEASKDNVIDQAYENAVASPLLVGIAIDSHKTVLHFKNLPKEEPLFTISNEKENLRKIGTNAARLVKGMEFKSIEYKKEKRK